MTVTRMGGSSLEQLPFPLAAPFMMITSVAVPPLEVRIRIESTVGACLGRLLTAVSPSFSLLLFGPARTPVALRAVAEAVEKRRALRLASFGASMGSEVSWRVLRIGIPSCVCTMVALTPYEAMRRSVSSMTVTSPMSSLVRWLVLWSVTYEIYHRNEHEYRRIPGDSGWN